MILSIWIGAGDDADVDKIEGLGRGTSLPGVTFGDRTNRFTLESRPSLGGISDVGVEGTDTGF